MWTRFLYKPCSRNSPLSPAVNSFGTHVREHMNQIQFVCLSLPLSVCLPLAGSLPLSVSVSVSVSLCLSLSLSLSVYCLFTVSNCMKNTQILYAQIELVNEDGNIQKYFRYTGDISKCYLQSQPVLHCRQTKVNWPIS